jgi:hypothetical protein
MAKIEKVELRMVDLVPKVKRTDAIQSFVSQETPIVTITDSDGATGAGYSYTIGTGGSSVMRLLADHLAPRIIGKDADQIEAIWRDLEFFTHATTVGAITSIALAAIDTALWDLRARKQGLPLWKLAGGAKDRCPLYTTEGGWLHIETAALVDDALQAQAKGFRGSKVKIGRPHGSEDFARLSAVRKAVGDSYEIMTDWPSRRTNPASARRVKAKSIRNSISLQRALARQHRLAQRRRLFQPASVALHKRAGQRLVLDHPRRRLEAARAAVHAADMADQQVLRSSDWRRSLASKLVPPVLKPPPAGPGNRPAPFPARCWGTGRCPSRTGSRCGSCRSSRKCRARRPAPARARRNGRRGWRGPARY